MNNNMKRFLIYVLTAVFMLTVNAKNNGANAADGTESGDFDITNTSIIRELVTPPTTISVTEGVTASKLTFKDKNNQTVVAFIINTSYGSDDRLKIAIGTPNDGDAFGMQKVSAQAVSAVANGKNVVAAVNGDYYNTGTGEPIGILIKDGRKIHDSDKNEAADKYWVFLGIKNDGTAVCGGKSLFNSIESELFQAIGGKGSLVKNGELDKDCIGTDAYGYKTPYPCTAAGIRKNGSVFFVAVDGKRPSTYSAGISKDDLAIWMKDMGAVDAIALDGGGSTTAVIKNPENGQYAVFNSPSDKTAGPTGGTERAVANSIQILRTVSDDNVGLGNTVGGRWTEERAAQWKKEAGWLTGVNYIVSDAINSIAMFDKTSYNPELIDKELALADELGFNCIRVLVPYALYADDPDRLLKTFDNFLSICEKHRITVMPTLFDDCTFDDSEPKAGKQPEPIIGWYASYWSPSPGKKMVNDPAAHPQLEKYLKTFIERFKNDRRVAIWDIYNEPSGSKESLILVEKVFRWAREVNPSQPLTVCTWNGNKELNDLVTGNSDVISFHVYSDANATKKFIEALNVHRRPLICTEWLHRPKKSTVAEVMPILKEMQTGSFMWGLVNGKTQTHLIWGHRPEHLPYTGPWQHDLFHNDFKPYDENELRIIRELNAKLCVGQWTVEQANEWYAAQQKIVGCNFLPSTAVNDVEMWQSATFDPKTINRELGWAAKWGINSVRVFLNYVVWEAEPEKFKKNFAKFLHIAAKHKISVMPILFDDCNFSDLVAAVGKQPDPVPGVHNSRWVSSPPLKMLGDRSAHPKLKAYLQDMVGTFGQDKRIIIWDLYNEPGNGGQNDKNIDLIKNIFVWTREMKPIQPLTISAWTDFNGRMPQMFMLHSDIVSYHNYSEPKVFKSIIEICRKHGRPLVCTEWLFRQGGNTPENCFPIFDEYKVGFYNWGLVEGRTQTYFHWGSKKDTPVPEIWQHDLIRKNGKPYIEEEYPLFRKFAGKEK